MLYICISVAPVVAQSIVTVAGGGTDDGRPAVEAGLYAPWGVVLDASGNIYFTDSTNFRVRKVSVANGLITTVAGNGYRGYSGDGGPASAAELDYPRGLEIDGAGNLYVADFANHRVRKVDARTGIITTVAGAGTSGFSGDGGPASAARLFNPVAVAVTSAGDVYIADRDNHRIRKVAAGSGVISTAAGNGSPGFSGDGGPATEAALANPSAVVTDISGNLYIADTVNQRIRRVDVASGVISTVAGTGVRGFSGDGGPATAATFAVPQGIALDRAGNIFVGDSVNERVRRIDAATGIITTVAGNGNQEYPGDGGPATAAAVYRPRGLFVDGSTDLYIAAEFSDRVHKVSAASGVITTVAGIGSLGFAGDGRPATAAGFYQPEGVTLDGAGNLYAADYLSGLVRKVSAGTGIISTVAGNPFGGSRGDGILATAALLVNPGGLTLDASGNLYISDWGDHRVRRVAAGTGIIETVAGTGKEGFSGDGGPATAAAISHPDGLLVDASGNLLLSDRWNHRIRRIEAANGTISTIVGNGTAGYSGDGGPATAASLNYPGGLAFDAAANLFFAETANHTVRKVAVGSGIISTAAGTGTSGFWGDGGPATAAGLNQPYGAAFDTAGNFFIADTYNQRVRRVEAGSGIITTIAGTGATGFAGDGGPATAAALSYPYGVAVGPLGEVYIASNHRIQAVFPCVASVGAFDSLLPGDAASANASSLNLSWAKSQWAFRYDLIVDTAFPPKKVVQPDVTGEVVTVNGLQPGQTYYWQVRAKGDPNCPTPPTRVSTLRRFTTLRPCTAPAPPVLVAPPDPATTTRLVFSPVEGAASYDLYLGTGASLPLAAAGLSSPSYTAADLAPGATYRWRVVAHAACNPDLASSSRESSFTVPGNCSPPGRFAQSSPHDGAAEVPGEPTLRWDAASGAASYDVYLGPFDPPALYASGVTTNSLPTVLGAGATYHWKVVAHSACLPARSTESAVATFSTSTACATPGVPANLVSSKSAAEVGGTYTLSWLPVEGMTAAGQYRVERSKTASFEVAQAYFTARTSLLLTATERSTYHHRVVAAASCGKQSAPSVPLAVSTGEAPPVIVLVTPPRAVVVRQPPPGKLLPRLEVEVRNVGKSDFLGFFNTAQSIPFFQMSETAISLRKGESRIFYLQFNGVPQDRPGSYEGTLSLVSADPFSSQAFPQASVSLTVTDTRPTDPDPPDIAAPVFESGGVPIDTVRFAPTPTGEQPPDVLVDIRNPGGVPLYLAGDVAPDPWVSPEPRWNSEPIPPRSVRTVKLQSQRIRGEHGGTFPRSTYFTIRTADGKSARLTVQDSSLTAVGPCPARPALGAGEASLIIPAVVNARGIGGTRFVSRVLVTNLGTDPAPVEMYYTPDLGGEEVDGYDCTRVRHTSLVVPPNDVLAIDDVAGQLFGVENGSGQLEIRSGRIGQLRVQSVVDAPAATGGSFGFQVPTVRSGEGVRPGRPYSVIGIVQDAAYRTNIILSETSGQRSSVRLTLFDRNGTVRGTAERDLSPWSKVQLPVTELSAGDTLDAGAIEVEARDGSAGSVIALITVIDNRTGDASSFVARPLKPETASTSYAVTSVASTSTFRSRLEIRNNGASPANYRLVYRGNTGRVESGLRSLMPKQEDAWENVLADLFKLPAGTFGPLAIEADSPGLQIVSRVYVSGPGGTYGDAIEGIALDAGTTTGDSGRMLVVDGLEGTANGGRSRGARTNLILSEIGGGEAVVEVAIWDKTQRRIAPVSRLTLSLAPHEQRQINDLFGVQGFGVGERDWVNVLCTVRPAAASTGKLSVLATRIDNVTNDTKNLTLEP
ncbi:MAG: hypothetical protein L6R30_25095 [Thermoanaerobaculia bacterium]|nr:hypothetical protein [Thermoanaerobaculia bacterium]